MESAPLEKNTQCKFGVSLAALGFVCGDIGTSSLYPMGAQLNERILFRLPTSPVIDLSEQIEI